MSQQINLYAERLRPSREWLTGQRLALALVLLGALLALAVGLTRSAAERSTAELKRVQADVAASQQAVAALTKTLAARTVPAALKAEIDSARAQLASRQTAMAQLDSGQLGSRDGFSAVFEGLAYLASNDLWLTGFAVGAGGREIEISGRLLDPARLPAYVQRLGEEAAFKGMRFAALDLKRGETAEGQRDPAAKPTSETEPRYLEFVLRSENGGRIEPAAGGSK